MLVIPWRKRQREREFFGRWGGGKEREMDFFFYSEFQQCLRKNDIIVVERLSKIRLPNNGKIFHPRHFFIPPTKGRRMEH